MSFADIQNRIELDNNFPEPDKATILAVMRTAYEGSPIAKVMIDAWLQEPTNKIRFNYRPGEFGVDTQRRLNIDLAELKNAMYIDNFGKAVRDTADTAIIHELVHALRGFEDHEDLIIGHATTEYRQPTVIFANAIYNELGFPEQNSYIGNDKTGVLVNNYQYTNGEEIDRSVVANGEKFLDWDSSDAGNSKDLLIGNEDGNELIAGEGDDFLYGNAGNDRLDGGSGKDILNGGKDSDTLIGGTGYDRYVIEGSDTVEDSDGEGILTDKTGRHISGMLQKREDGTYISRSDSITSASGSTDLTLTLTDGSSVTIKNYQDGDLGIQLFEEEALPTQFDRTIVGDLQPIDFDPNTAGVQTRTDDLGNVIVDASKPEPGRNDGFHDSAGNDLIKGLGGNDNIFSWRGGNDQIEGGDGDDWMIGGMGKDIVIGGAGRDVLVEGGDDDKLYADNVVTLEAAIAAQNAAPSGAQGEALSGGDGNDLAIGGTGNDVLFGGTGDDILVAGAGNDDIDGDAMAGNIMSNWSTQRSATPTANGTSYNILYNQFNMTWPTVGGDDVIYAGAGEDWVSAGYGNDYVDGGNDADKLWGEGGNDNVFGGAGNDLLNGDNARLSIAEQGDDYLDGEDGDDLMFGEGGSDQLFGGAGNDKLYADNADGSGAGKDYLDGEAGNDQLLGGALDDELFGGEGNDFLQGDSGTGRSDGDDYLDGEAGDDILLGEGGKDEIHGGAGADQIAGDNGGSDTSGEADTLYGGAGNDIIDGQGGDDVIDGGADNDIVAGGAGADNLNGGLGDDQLQGGTGDDTISGNEGNDTLFGEDGADRVNGDDGNDYLIGGKGNDTLNGGLGDDVYVYYLGDGTDTIIDAGGIDWLVLPQVWWQSMRIGTGSLKLTLPDGAEIHLDDFDPDNPHAAGGIEYFQFADGTVMTKTQLINALGIQPTGTPEADMLTGTALTETIHALAGDDVVTARAGNDTVYAEDGADVVYGGDGNDIIYGGNGDDVLLGENGNDTLYGEAGNDLLSGGAGADALQGGDGNDTYLFQTGDGQDTATDALGTNAIVLGSGLTLDAIVFTRQGSDLLVAVKNSTDRLTVKDWFAADSHFASITLGDGTPLDHAGVEAAMPRNQAPVATLDAATVVEDGTTTVTGNALANDSDPEGRTLRITDPGTYAGTVGTLSLGSNGAYSYTLANSSQAVQSLAAGQSLTETFAYTVTDDDPNGAATASSSIRITVHGVNDLPTLGADSTTTSEDAGPISGNVLSNDSDIDAGTTLTVANPGQRTGTYGSLSLGSTGAWSYSLANASAAVQSLAAGQTVTDNFSFNVSDGVAQVGGSLSVRITGQNDAPIVVTPLADQSASANSSWTWQLPTGSFADVDAGDVLGYTATLADGTALPSWLAFDAATQTFSGRVPKSATGTIDIRIAATDRQGAAAADVFTLSFAAGTGGGGGGNTGGSNGGGSQGNEGVGNGIDGPPPGHDTSFNDGTGTSPGNPGAQGGNGYVPPKRADILLQDVQVNGRRMAEAAAGNERGNSVDAHASAPGQVRQDSTPPADALPTIADNGQTGNGNAHVQESKAADAAVTMDPSATPKWLQEAAWAYLDTRGSDASYTATGGGGDTVTSFMQWLAVQQALADQGRNGLPDWLDVSKGADTSGMLLSDSRFLGKNLATGNDPLSLQAATALKSFSGFGNGLQKIG